ncbi:MAG: hypothetical protein H0Z19_07265 [Archaeoglobus sp.]|uniref:hypothetical protein n=1 Tax=Archaeoglobus sp. TaxID=1872626 RepID=UPI001E0388E6|nr:hypothetical protein [Archaeoglobus sp.]MBO8180263.1 hypothetical protein [Archaeoglobus sp.]
MKLIARQLLKNKPYFFVGSNSDAFTISLKLQAVIIAKYFGISPVEVLNWSYSEMQEFLALIDVISEAESNNNGRDKTVYDLKEIEGERDGK